MIESPKVEIRRLGIGDEQLAQTAMLLLVPEDERDGCTPSLEHLNTLLKSPSNYLILSLLDRNPIGFTIAYSMPTYARDGKMAYLYEIGVLPDHHRKGIGSRMIAFLKECMRDEGVNSMWVGADIKNTPAISLYEATGAKRDSFMIHEFWYNDLKDIGVKATHLT